MYLKIIIPNGTAMNYQLSTAPIIPNSDILLLEILDREDGVVVDSRELIRGVDYSIDSLSGYITFNEPLMRRDTEGRWQQVRVGYDVKGDGRLYAVVGTRLQKQVHEAVTVGASYTRDNHPINNSDIAGGWLEYRPSYNTLVAFSAAHIAGQSSESKIKQDTESYRGNALRLTAKNKWNTAHESSFRWVRADNSFKHSGSDTSPGQEDIRLQHQYVWSRDVDIHSGIEANNALETNDGSLSANIKTLYRFRDGWQGILGSRLIHQRMNDSSERLVTGLLGLKKKFSIWERSVSLKGEYEQALAANRSRAKLSSDITIYNQLKLYGRLAHNNRLSHGVSNSVSNEFSLGLKNSWTDNVSTYSEYRQQKNSANNTQEWVNGTKADLEVASGVFITPSIEWVHNLKGDDGLAISLAAKDKRKVDMRSTGRFEYRYGKSKDYFGIKAAMAKQLGSDWSGLIKEEFRLERFKNEGQHNRLKHSLSFGVGTAPPIDESRE